MKLRNLIASAALLAASVVAAAPAQAVLIAGWDFSQWLSAGILSTDGAEAATTLSANYSGLDPTFGLGPDSGPFGTMFINGANGSTQIVPDFTGSEAFVPGAGSLNSNMNQPVPNPFDSLVLLQDQGQQFQNQLKMTAQGPVSVVFHADLSSVISVGSDWTLSFGGQTLAGATSVGVEFSTDGSSYAPLNSVNLTTLDSIFNLSIPASADGASGVFVRFNFANADTSNLPSIDNLGIAGIVTVVPEPGTLVLLGTGIAGLALKGRRRA